MKITTHAGTESGRTRDVGGRLWTLIEVLGSRWDLEEFIDYRALEPEVTGDLWNPGPSGAKIKLTGGSREYLEGYLPGAWSIPGEYPFEWEVIGADLSGTDEILITPGLPRVLTINLVCTEWSPRKTWDTIKVGVCGSSHPELSRIIDGLTERYSVPGLTGLVSRYGGAWEAILGSPKVLEELVRMDRSLDNARVWLTGVSGETHNGNTMITDQSGQTLSWSDGVVIKF